MKTLILRVMTLGLAVSGLALCAGCEEDQATAEGTPTSTRSDSDNLAAPAPSSPGLLWAAEAAPAPPLPVPTGQPLPAGQPADGAAAKKSASPATNAPGPAAQKLVLPGSLKLSPPLAEVVKLAQAGVSEEVLLSYIANSTNVFNVGADEIVYLNDLGVPSTVITTLIQHDSSPEALARQQVASSVKPLSPELELKTPATNIYPYQTPPPPPDTDYQQNAVAPPVYVNPPAGVPVEAASQPTDVNYFYSSMAPYGNWVEVPDYGLCWQPTVAVVNSYWRPYADCGRWYWTDCGWYWHSYYSWGWAPFHYGRWCSPAGIGWVWVPDTCWGPSWVTWRYTPYYCGWAPLPPRCHYVSGFGLYYQNSSVSIGFGFGFGCNDYTWIHSSYLCDPYPHHYYMAAGESRGIYAQSKVINNINFNKGTVVNNGFGVDRIARVSRTDVHNVAVRDEPMRAAGAGRFERVEHVGDTPVLVRPRLPEKPPTVSNLAPTRAATVPRRPAAPSTPPPSKRVSMESEKQATALMPSSSRTAASRTASGPAAMRPGTSPSGQPPVSVRPPLRQEPMALRAGGNSVVVTDGRNNSVADDPPPAPAAPSTRNNDRPKSSSPSTGAATRPANNFNDSSRNSGGIRIQRPEATGSQSARSGVPGSATLAAPAAPAAPSYVAPTARPSSPSMPMARNDVSRAPAASAPPPAAPTYRAPAPSRSMAPAPAAPSFTPPPSRPQYAPTPAPSAPVIRSQPAPAAPRVEVSRPSPPSSPPPASRPAPAPAPSRGR